MNFSCDRCHKRFTTSDQPVPGRTYRIPCGCGNTIVLEIRDPVAETLHAWSADRPYTTPPGMYRSSGPREPDPFTATQPLETRPEPLMDTTAPAAEARGVTESVPEVTPTFVGPLARRDPSARLDESSEYRLKGAISFDDVLQRTRRQGFLAGVAAGAAAGAVAAVALIVAMARFADGGAPPPEAPAPAARAPEAAVAPAPVPTPASEAPAARPPRPALLPRPAGERVLGEGTRRAAVRTGAASPPAPVPEPEMSRPTGNEQAPADRSDAVRKPDEVPEREAIDPAGGVADPEPEPARTAPPVQPLDDAEGDPARATEER